MEDWKKFDYSSNDYNNGFVMRDSDPKPEYMQDEVSQYEAPQYETSNSPEEDSSENIYYTDPEVEPKAYATNYSKKKEPKYVTKGFFAVVLIIAMLFSAGAGAAGFAIASGFIDKDSKAPADTNLNIAESTGSSLSVQQIVAKTQDSVVAIVTESVSRDNWLGQYVTQGAGSGVILTEDGYIVTNNHVIEGASTIKVTLNDGSEATAKLVATDEQTDVAVIKIDKKNLTAAAIGDSDELVIGELAVAIGNPLGEFAGSATEGIISGLEREITIDGRMMRLIQTSASINPGNSGGGLFDEHGNLIGIVVAKSSGSEVEGLGFAIPSNTVKKIADSLIEKGYVAGRPVAGISVIDLTDASTAMQYGVQLTGVYIAEVTGKNAKKAGLEAGDLIYYLEDTKITSQAQLASLIQSKNVGDEVTFTIIRDNKMFDVKVELEEATGQQ